MNAVRCSVVIPTRGPAAKVVNTVALLSRQDVRRADYEIVVVDNNVDEPTSAALVTALERFDVQVVRQTVEGPAAARNAGIASSTGEIVLFVDDDIEVSESFVASHLTVHTGTNPTVGIGRIVEHNKHSRWFRRYLVERRVINRIPVEGELDFRNFYGANASVPRSLLDALGGYDERFIRREDAELGYRLERAGAVFRLVTAPAHHHSDFGPLHHLRRSFWNGFYLAMLIETHPSIAARLDLTIYRPWKRWIGAAVGLPLIGAGAIVYPITPWPLFTGLTGLVLTQSSRGFASYRRRQQ